MTKQTEARLTEGSAKASAKRKAAPVQAARHGDAEMPRADAHHLDDDHEDERDSLDAHEMSEDEFLALFAGAQNESVLPTLPKIPGFHTFWATTTNPRDPIASRVKLGYRFIKPEELPGWDGVSIKTGDYVGCIGINEMVAMKIPERRYQLMMAEVHHRAPMAEEEKLRSAAESRGEDALRDKGRIVDEHGYMDSVVQKAPVPSFAA